jgi:hypothetical protein
MKRCSQQVTLFGCPGPNNRMLGQLDGWVQGGVAGDWGSPSTNPQRCSGPAARARGGDTQADEPAPDTVFCCSLSVTRGPRTVRKKSENAITEDILHLLMLVFEEA